MKVSKKKKFNFIFLIFLFLLGFIITIYPIMSNFYYRIKFNDEIKIFEKKTKEMSQEEIDKRIKLARAYNKAVDNTLIADPYSEEERKQGLAEYAKMIEIEKQIGFVEIPLIDEKIPIRAGSSNSVLEKGAGHLEGTSLPVGGEGTHTVITAHRGLPKVKLFRNLDKLRDGDVFYIHNIDTTLAYKVDKIQIVEPNNFDPILIEKGKDYATLVTCDPYMVNSHRLLVRGHRIDYIPAIDDGVMRISSVKQTYRRNFLISLFVIFVLCVILYKLKIREKS